MEKWDYGFALNYDILCDDCVSRTKIAMHREHKSRLETLSGLKLSTRHSSLKGVVAASSFRVGEVELVGVAPSVYVAKGVKEDNSVPLSCIDIGPAFRHPQTKLQCNA